MSQDRPVVLRDRGKACRRRLALLAARGRGSAAVEAAVRKIVGDVRRRGDRAVAACTKRFDGVDLRPRDFELDPDAWQQGAARTAPRVRRALKTAHRRILAFHKLERERGFERREPGIRSAVRMTALARVGVYVPGGRAAYPSSVLMNIVPAKVAGVADITVVTPPTAEGVRPEVLEAARIAGADRVLRIGGAQAVAALAYGTESIERVDKIVGPGNVYVATAKRLVVGEVGIDMIAGPSEVLIIADGRARPDWIAADMLAQAEHDPLAAAICVTTSARVGDAVAAAVAEQIAELPRAAIARRSIARYGTVLVVADLRRAAELANELAPEHVELFVASPRKLVASIRNAGAIFLGASSTEALGDYAAGPNHVLPTGTAARFSSPLGVYDFVKRTRIIEVDRRGLAELAPTVTVLARAEGLEAHARAVEMRTAGERKTR